ncbi:uncharacterized protein LOC117569557 isoform X8 [Drosophila albomicans]|uniref:Uncharacterized protein LOC117569557 isoform X7 n=1 Tax=Drosophila albomicans TaxID=7291 RepID=A0A9C6SYB0_DROAB|nr:uncharacterized protein LOC117575124 isoform X2 [Drosophila albomicans]XP_051864275.1 uncharacterized protein LOC117569557 isoform X7 [Drosophila albomicans]XP_051864276.1 uncharacterized protein LOC117569557 isoform X8 [Drosophila albomicans]
MYNCYTDILMVFVLAKVHLCRQPNTCNRWLSTAGVCPPIPSAVFQIRIRHLVIFYIKPDTPQTGTNTRKDLSAWESLMYWCVLLVGPFLEPHAI